MRRFFAWPFPDPEGSGLDFAGVVRPSPPKRFWSDHFSDRLVRWSRGHSHWRSTLRSFSLAGSRCRVNRSSRLRPGPFRSPQVNLGIPFLARHCSRLDRATAVRALSPLFTIRARLPGTFRERRVPGRSAVIGRSTSGLCSTVKSVTTRRRFRPRIARCFLGLCSIEGLLSSRVDRCVPWCRCAGAPDGRTPEHPVRLA